jgi:hypothetical protein
MSICDEATDSDYFAAMARIGDTVGPCCEDCAEWCDGNLITQA